VYFSFGEILVLFLFGAVCLHFLASIRVKELALHAVSRASRREDFQLLDQAVHLRRISLSRDHSGRWRIWRQSHSSKSSGLLISSTGSLTLPMS